MALTYKEVRRAVRFKERDNDEVKFSDYDIREAVNESIRYISQSLADSNADFNEKQQIYHHEECECPCGLIGLSLPYDYMAMVSVAGLHPEEGVFTPCLASELPKPGEYKVIGDNIYCGSPAFILTYKASILEVETEEDEIAIPYIAKDVFVTLVRRVLTRAEGDIMREAQESALNALLPKRRYRNAHVRMPFKV